MLRSRLLSAAIVISVALVFVFLDARWPVLQCAGFWMVPLGMYLYFGSAIECVRLFSQGPIGPISRPAAIGCAGVMIAAAIPVYWPIIAGEAYPADCLLGELGLPLAAIAISQVACFAWYIPNYQSGSNMFARAILAGWVSVYFGGCFAFAIALRLTGTPDWGLYLLVGAILVTKCSDAGAYFVGRALGKTKLCPAVSPGKTIEGLVGGMLVAVLASWVYYCLCAPLVFAQEELEVTLLGVVVLGMLVTIAGVLGDLLESMFKREACAKDSGTLLPGLGGLWDVTDSLLPAIVVGYLVVAADLIHGPGQ